MLDLQVFTAVMLIAMYHHCCSLYLASERFWGFREVTSCYYFDYSTSFAFTSFLFLGFIEPLPSASTVLFLSHVTSLYFGGESTFIAAFAASSIAYALLVFRLHHESTFQLALKYSYFPLIPKRKSFSRSRPQLSRIL